MDESAARHDVPGEEPSRVDEHVSCLRCNYDLHGLEMSRACPECGTPISRTLDGNLLRFSSTTYLRNLATGILLLVLSNIISLVGMLLMIPVSIALGFAGAAAGGYDAAWIMVFSIVASLFGLGVGILALVGWWKFSTPDPDFVGNDTAHGYRLALRIMVTIYAVMLVIAFPTELLVQTTDFVVFEAASFTLSVVSTLLGIAMFFVSLLFLRVIAQRIPDRSLMKQAGTYLWLLPVIFILGACIIIGPIIATVMYLVYLWRVRRPLLALLEDRSSAELAH